jgi:hypothetical protein
MLKNHTNHQNSSMFTINPTLFITKFFITMNFKYSFSLALCIFFMPFMFGQGNNCGDTEPVLQCPATTCLGLTDTTSSPVLSVNSNLPNIEYAIVDFSMPSTSGTGPSIVAVDQDGIFTPAQYNLTAGTQFGVIPVAYDLAAIQETLDDLLKGNTFLGSCCSVAINFGGVDICGPLNMAGITCGADVNNLEQASNAFTMLSGGGAANTSIVDLIDQINQVNAQLADIIFTDCGGGDKFAFAYGLECVYTLSSNTVFTVPMDHQMDELVANYAIRSPVTVNSPFVVDYNASECIELQPSFETIVGSTFHAEIVNSCL